MMVLIFKLEIMVDDEEQVFVVWYLCSAHVYFVYVYMVGVG